jgi:hypothetical protein
VLVVEDRSRLVVTEAMNTETVAKSGYRIGV